MSIYEIPLGNSTTLFLKCIIVHWSDARKSVGFFAIYNHLAVNRAVIAIFKKNRQIAALIFLLVKGGTYYCT